MAIKVGHGLRAGSVAGAAFLGAQGQAAAQQREQLGAQAIHVAALNQAEAERLAKPEEQKASFLLEQQQADAAQARQQQNMRLNTDLQTQLSQSAHTLGQQDAIAAQGRQRDDLVFGLTTRQNMQLSQLADSEAQALADPSFSPQDKEELKYRFAQRRAGIQPVARPKPLTPAELFKQRTFTDPRSGNVYPLDENGVPGRPILERPERLATVQDRVKAWQAALASADPQGLGGPDVEAKARGFYKMMMEGTEPPVEAVPAPDTSGLSAGGQQTPLPLLGRAAYGLRDLVTGAPGTPAGVPGGAPGAPDLGTLDGVQRKVAQIESPTIMRGAIKPEDAQNLATVDHQLSVARDLLGQHEKGMAVAQERMKNPADRIWAQGHYISASNNAIPLRDRVAALEKRRTALAAQRDDLQALSIAAQIKQGAQAPAGQPAPAAAYPSFNADPSFGLPPVPAGGQPLERQVTPAPGPQLVRQTEQVGGGPAGPLDPRFVADYARLRGLTLGQARAMLTAFDKRTR